jgi:hypothetical protein
MRDHTTKSVVAETDVLNRAVMLSEAKHLWFSSVSLAPICDQRFFVSVRMTFATAFCAHPKHVLTHNVRGFARYVSGVSRNATLPSKSGRNPYNGGIDRNRSL